MTRDFRFPFDVQAWLQSMPTITTADDWRCLDRACDGKFDLESADQCPCDTCSVVWSWPEVKKRNDRRAANAGGSK